MHEGASVKAAGRRHYPVKAIIPSAIQGLMYVAVGAGALYFSYGTQGLDRTASIAVFAAALAYCAIKAARYANTYYSVGENGVEIKQKGKRISISWGNIDSARYDSSSRAIELVLSSGTRVLLYEYDRLDELIEGLDKRSVRIEYMRKR